MAVVADTRKGGRRRPAGRMPVLGVAMPGKRAFRVWQRNLDVFLQLWKTELIWPLVEPVIMFLALGLGLGTYVQLTGDTDYIRFLGPGVLAMFPMWAASFEGLWGAYFRMDRHGTYDAILATPVRVEEIFAGEVMWAGTRGVISAVLILVVMLVLTPFYGLLQSPLALFTVVSAFLNGAVFAGLGLAFTSRARAISQLNYFVSLLLLPMFWFSGGFFPLDRLPDWAQTLAWFMPLYHAVELNRGLVSGDVGLAHLGHVVWLAVVAIPTTWLALFAMRDRLVK
jgi:lipooligosaccharide transport system permease protein